MPLATSRSLGREDQQYILAKLTGLASLAAAVSLEVGKPPLDALRLLELGHSVTNGQLIDYRSDISDLIEQHPMLAKHFNFLCQELDSPFPSTESLVDISVDQRLRIQQTAIHKRNQAGKDLDYILQQIRQKPGFEHFLRVASEESLLSAAEEGPIVALNVTELRSDAILVTKEKVTNIGLPHLSYASMVWSLDIGPLAARDDNEFQREILEWLWKAAVQPVLRD